MAESKNILFYLLYREGLVLQGRIRLSSFFPLGTCAVWSYTDSMSEQFKVGWREWVGLPDLGFPAIKAKLDTGARTSSLHALDPEPCLLEGVPHVRFILLPVQNSLALGQEVLAPLVDRRKVTNSGGLGQERYVIGLTLMIGGYERQIEATLANRRDMRFRMLLGRQALEGILIDPLASYLLGKSSEQKEFLRYVRQELTQDRLS